MSDPMLLHLKHQKLYLFLFYILEFNTLSFCNIGKLLKCLLFLLCAINKKITFLKLYLKLLIKAELLN